MGLLETRRMIAAGDLKLWLDFRSGHCANQAGYSGGAFDGVVRGTAGRFRTGYGYETSHDYAAGDPSSLGYIRVTDNAAFYPPAEGLCLVASYMQTNDDTTCQIIGQGDARGVLSWQLIRTPTQIQFLTSDGVGASTFSYNLASVEGEIETVVVRYTGGTGANNCTIAVLAPTPSTSTGQINRVPGDLAQPVSICCFSNSTAAAFMGTMRYCAYIRGAQTAATLVAVAAEMEAISWSDAVSVCDRAGTITDRTVQYMSRFGVDQSVADEGLVGARLSNSEWVFGDAMDDNAGLWRVNPYHTQYAAAGGPSDVVKLLRCNSQAPNMGTVRLPYENWNAAITQALAAYGTWDFWVWRPNDPMSQVITYVVHTITDDGAGTYYDDGYAVLFGESGMDNLELCRMDDGDVSASLISTPDGLFGGGMLVHIRVNRDAGNNWRLYYDIGAGWVYVGTAVDDDHVVSDGMFLNYGYDDALLIGNQRSDKALYKWRGVVNPR